MIYVFLVPPAWYTGPPLTGRRARTEENVATRAWLLLSVGEEQSPEEPPEEPAVWCSPSLRFPLG